MISSRDGEYHRSVMLDRVLELLRGTSPDKGSAVFVDATLGGGGHAEGLLSSFGSNVRLIGIDRDPDAVRAACKRLEKYDGRIRLVKGRMGDLSEILDREGIDDVDGILADLGASSFQLDNAQRGFSFMKNGPLDMRMDPDCGKSAAEILNMVDETELANAIYEYGEERHSRRIARAILSAREMETTGQLAAAICSAYPRGKRLSRINPATRSFQALRILVNDELGELRRFLETAPQRLKPGGRMVVMSYHSLEDRMVKRTFAGLAKSEAFVLPFRKVMKPSDYEIKENPRARSARVRALDKGPG